MYNELAQQAEKMAYDTVGSSIRQMPLKEQVVLHIKGLEKQLEEKKQLLELLEKNPDFEKMYNLMR